MAAIERGLHVLVTKPAVKTLKHHSLLHEVRIVDVDKSTSINISYELDIVFF